jgi:hypothetical protein
VFHPIAAPISDSHQVRRFRVLRANTGGIDKRFERRLAIAQGERSFRLMQLSIHQAPAPDRRSGKNQRERQRRENASQERPLSLPRFARTLVATATKHD